MNSLRLGVNPVFVYMCQLSEGFKPEIKMWNIQFCFKGGKVSERLYLQQYVLKIDH